MNLGLHCEVRQTLDLRSELKLVFGETSGDIPIYSLHRIKNMIRRKPIGISKELENMLVRNLIAENRHYKRTSGNDWSCLTSSNLFAAIGQTDTDVGCTIGAIKSVPDEYAAVATMIMRGLTARKDSELTLIKNWFHENYSDLLYIRDGRIPWPVIRRMRADLSTWIAGAANPFTQNIEEMIMDVAQKEKIFAEDAEDAWLAMGGHLLNKDR